MRIKVSKISTILETGCNLGVMGVNEGLNEGYRIPVTMYRTVKVEYGTAGIVFSVNVILNICHKLKFPVQL
jgi:hypothetical protein